MVAALFAFFKLIPGLSTLAASWLTAVYNAKVAITTAQIGGDTAVATEMVRASAAEYASGTDRLKAIGASRFLQFLVFSFAFPWIAYEWKIIIWDTMLEWGSTASIHGDMGQWGHIIILSLFGSSTTLAVGHLYFDNRAKVK